jgi:two-component system, NarL family, sensor histidine kinase DesK
MEASEPVRWVRGWRRLALATGMLVYPLITAIGVHQYAHGGAAVAGYAVVLVFAVTYVLSGAAAVREMRRAYWLLTALMSVLFVAALPLAHENAFFLAAVLVSMVVTTHRRAGLALLVVVVLASLFVPWSIRAWHTGVAWVQALAIVFTVLTVYAFAELTRANLALVEARADVARLASEAERARIARDLHDLLGHSLTAITLKSGLARRLVSADTAAGTAGGSSAGSQQALVEITEVEQLSRQALSEVRAAIAGYRDVTLAGELARGRELLRAAGVTADLPTAVDQGPHQELFGWVVREGLTNVARHARATQCTVTVTPTSVEVRDNGVGGADHQNGNRNGNGLNGLRERVTAAGGSIEAGPLSPRGWRLLVTV